MSRFPEDHDPFTGTWVFDASRSTLSTPPPNDWRREIEATLDDLTVREEIVSSDGSRQLVAVQARFNGEDYPVSGLPEADLISYARPNAKTITAVGKRDGSVSITEQVTVSQDRNALTLIYVIYRNNRDVAKGVAVFVRKS